MNLKSSPAGSSDTDKTREQLLSELQGLKAEVAFLKNNGAQGESPGGALRESEDWFRAVFESVRDLILIIRPEGQIINVNRAVVETLGYSKEELLRMNVSDLRPAFEKPKLLEQLEKGREGHVFETHYMGKDGRVFPVEISVKAAMLKGEMAYFGIARDITDRKRVEETLRYSEARFRALFEDAGDAIFIADVDSGVIIDCNPNAEKLVGRPRSEIIGLHQTRLHPRGKAEEYRKLFRQHAREGGTLGLEMEVLHRDGRRIPVIISARSVLFNGKRIMMGYFIDITGRKLAEKDLRLTQFSIDRAADMALWVAPDARFIYANEAACRAFGYTKEEFLKLRAFDTDPRFNETNWGEHWKEVKERGSYTSETRLRRKDGTFFPGEVTVNYLVYEGREYNCSYIRDITGRKKAEETLRISRENLARAQEIAHLGNWSWDIETNEQEWSDESYRIFGFEPGEVRPDRDLYMGLLHPDDRGRILALTEALLAGDTPYDVDYRIVRRDGSIRYIHSEGRTARDQDGRPARMFGINQDITGRKQAEEELKAAKAQAELYVDLMGHDINNMNQISMGFLELARNIMEMEGCLDEGNIGLLDRAMGSLKNSSQLIDNVRKLQREKLGLYRREVLDVDAVIKDAIGQFRHVPGRNARVACDAHEPCFVEADALLKDVFVNLIGNAVKHSKRDLEVNVRVHRTADDGKAYCRIDVEDNGPGIPDPLKETLFDRLNLTSTRAKGKGFGLCLIKMLVDEYQGKFWVEDRVPGDHTQGARFVVMLPSVEK